MHTNKTWSEQNGCETGIKAVGHREQRKLSLAHSQSKPSEGTGGLQNSTADMVQFGTFVNHLAMKQHTYCACRLHK